MTIKVEYEGVGTLIEVYCIAYNELREGSQDPALLDIFKVTSGALRNIIPLRNGMIIPNTIGPMAINSSNFKALLMEMAK